LAVILRLRLPQRDRRAGVPRYAKVYEARMLGIKVALKETTSKKETSKPALFREIRYLRQAGPHPNIVQIFGAFTERNRVCLVMAVAKYVRVAMPPTSNQCALRICPRSPAFSHTHPLRKCASASSCAVGVSL
jgi:hypothetical protein